MSPNHQSVRPVDTLTGAFAAARKEGRAALIGYLPAGFPDTAGSVAAVGDVVRAGCDIVEIGISYSDPMLDGPTIQAATAAALAGGVRVRGVFAHAEAVAAAGGVPVVMSYWNPILQYGVDRFARDLAAAGGAGIITPDLLPEFGAEWESAAETHGLGKSYLVAPSTTAERLATTVAHSSGFVYAASTMGVTGARDAVSDAAPELVARVRAVSSIPVGVGLGVKNRAQAAAIGAYTDGVIVGSSLVTALATGPTALTELVAELAQGVRQAERTGTVSA